MRDTFAGVEVTCVDAGMPVVLLRASDLGITGYESPTELEANDTLTQKVEEIRLLAGAAMGLGDVRDATVPKMSLVAPPRAGGAISTRTFIPHRVHTSIGVRRRHFGRRGSAAARIRGARRTSTPERSIVAGPSDRAPDRVLRRGGGADRRPEPATQSAAAQ